MLDTSIRPAAIEWDENGQPRSGDFDDVYFTRISGVKESRYVFVEQNDLPERFTAMPEHGVFTIGETGFGSGLNFLCAWHCFIHHAPDSARLHFISVEKFPVTASDITQALALWPELAILAQQLIAQYPGCIPGFHRRSFAKGRIQLTLVIDDVDNALPELACAIDAWFLDGFAPSKNPQMWQPQLFHDMTQISAPHATYATFTVAQMVRKGIDAAGLSMSKVTGFGKKREMIRGMVTPNAGTARQTTGRPAIKAAQKPWLEPQVAATQIRTAVIIGAGIAGASTARALAERGWQVTVLDQNETPACGASGNPQGMLYTRLSPHDTALTRLVVQGYRHTINLLQQTPDDIYQLCGLIQLPDSEKEQKRQQQLAECGRFSNMLEYKTAQQLTALAGTAITSDGLWFHDGGWLNPPALVNWLLEHNNIQFHGNSRVQTLAHSVSAQAQAQAQIQKQIQTTTGKSPLITVNNCKALW